MFRMVVRKYCPTFAEWVFGPITVDEIIAPIDDAIASLSHKVVSNGMKQNQNRDEIALLLDENNALFKESQRAQHIAEKFGTMFSRNPD